MLLTHSVLICQIKQQHSAALSWSVMVLTWQFKPVVLIVMCRENKELQSSAFQNGVDSVYATILYAQRTCRELVCFGVHAVQNCDI